MRIAVCLYGHVGGAIGRDGEGGWLDPTIAFDSYKKNLFCGHEIDCFVHSWSTNHTKIINKLYSPKKLIIEPQIDFSAITYKNYKIDSIDSYRNYFKSYEGDIADKILTPTAQRSNSRWLSAKKSINLMQEYIEEKNAEYSLVIHLRFDLFLMKKIDIDNSFLKEFSCVERQRDNNQSVDDLIFISTVEQAIAFSKLYDCIFDYSIRPPFAAMQHLKKLGIVPKYNLDETAITLLRRKLKRDSSLFANFRVFLRNIYRNFD